MDWKLLDKNNRYFNPYKEYRGYEMVSAEIYNNLPTVIEYENVTIKHDIGLGKTHIFFDLKRFIIALDLILYTLALEANLETPIIASIYFNEKEIYNQKDINMWEYTGEIEKAITKTNNFGLYCESLLKNKNNFVINFKKNLRFTTNDNKPEYYTLYGSLFYKETADRDKGYYLRETLNKYKIKN